MSGIKLRTENLAVGYSGRVLIGDIALSLHQGQIMTLIGPNGAGKSTILKSVIRQLALVGGAVYLNGRDMAPMPEREVARRLSVLMTGHIHPELMTCFDVAATGRYPYTGRLGILSREDREKVSQCLELVHAFELAEQDFSRISDGQRQRVLLARLGSLIYSCDGVANYVITAPAADVPVAGDQLPMLGTLRVEGKT